MATWVTWQLVTPVQSEVTLHVDLYKSLNNSLLVKRNNSFRHYHVLRKVSDSGKQPLFRRFLFICHRLAYPIVPNIRIIAIMFFIIIKNSLDIMPCLTKRNVG